VVVRASSVRASGPRVLGLCAGIGGLELGVRLCDPRAHAVCFVERQDSAAAALVARMEDEAMAPAPVWDELATFDGRPWRGVVDLVTAGIPCQPFSRAGNRRDLAAARGVADPRWQWPHAKRIIGECEPGWVFLENVPALEDNEAFGVIVSDLGRLGYRTASIVVDAFAVGASQGRARLFVLAHADGAGRSGVTQRDLQPDPWSGVSAPRWLDADRRALYPPRAGRVGDWAQWPAAAQPHLHGSLAGAPGRVDRLHLTGNAVSPLVAAYALGHLWSALAGERLCVPAGRRFDLS